MNSALSLDLARALATARTADASRQTRRLARTRTAGRGSRTGRPSFGVLRAVTR